MCKELERLGQEKQALTKMLSAIKVLKEECRLNVKPLELKEQKEVEEIQRELKKEECSRELKLTKVASR